MDLIGFVLFEFENKKYFSASSVDG